MPGVLDVLHDAADHDARAVADRVDVALERVLQEPVDEHRAAPPTRARPFGNTAASDASSYTICIARPPSTYDGRTSTGYPMRSRDLERLLEARRRAVRRLRQSELARDLVEPAPILGDVDRVGRRPENPHAGGLELPRELERRLTAELHDHALRLLALHDLEHVLERQRLEVQLVRRIEVRGDRFRIRVDHDRLEPALAQREHGAHAAVVELHALPDAIRAAAEDHDRPLAAPRRFALLVVAAVQVRRRRRKLAGAGVDHLVRRANVQRPAALARPRVSSSPRSAPSWRSEKPMPLHAAHVVLASTSASAAYSRSASISSDHLLEEPRVDPRELVHLGDGQPALERALDLEDPLGRRLAQRAAQRLVRVVRQAIVLQARADRPAVPAGLERAQSLLERLLERAADRHRLAHRLHLRREVRAGATETSRTRSAASSRRRSRAPARTTPASSS